jgi:hypothetical protein
MMMLSRGFRVVIREAQGRNVFGEGAANRIPRLPWVSLPEVSPPVTPSLTRFGVVCTCRLAVIVRCRRADNLNGGIITCQNCQDKHGQFVKAGLTNQRRDFDTGAR